MSTLRGAVHKLSVFYIPKSKVAILKYINKLQASTIVVIKGDAITAGSNPILFANIGSVAPINLAIIIVKHKVMHIVNAIIALT